MQGLFWLGWVHSSAPWGRRVHSGTPGLSGVCLGVVRFAWVHSGSPWGRRGSRSFTRAGLGVVGLIRVRLWLLWLD